LYCQSDVFAVVSRGAVEWVLKRWHAQRMQEMFDRWFDHNLAVREAKAEASGGPKRTTTAAF
jgi:hypothetical protein